jgi:hypothetical protein
MTQNRCEGPGAKQFWRNQILMQARILLCGPTDRQTNRPMDRQTNDKESYRGAMLAPKNKSQTQTRRKLSWGEAIWGPTDRPTNQPTDRQTKSPTPQPWNPRWIWECIPNIFGIYSGIYLRYIPNILGYECIRDISWIYPRCIPDIYQIHLTSQIYLEYIPNLTRMTNSSGIYLFIPQISGIPRLGGIQTLACA